MPKLDKATPSAAGQSSSRERPPWNKGKQIGQKPALTPEQVTLIRAWLTNRDVLRDRVLFELAIDSKLRASDLVALRWDDVALHTGSIKHRTSVIQCKTQRPVQFELGSRARELLEDWRLVPVSARSRFLFPSVSPERHITTRQYARLLKAWMVAIGLNAALYGTHSLRRTKVALIYRETRNIRAIQLLLGHSNLENTVRYLGFEMDDALALSEGFDI